MTLNQIIDKVAALYQDDIIYGYWDKVREAPIDNPKKPNLFTGDGLAMFIVNEVYSIYDPDGSDESQMEDLKQAMTVAVEELRKVAEGL